MKIIDRRASSAPESDTPALPEVDRREDGSIRRPGAGGRTMADFFAEGNLQRPLTRGDYLNLRASEEWSRRKTTFWQWLWRTIRLQPSPQPVNRRLADAHQRQLDAIAIVVAQQEAEKAAGGDR